MYSLIDYGHSCPCGVHTAVSALGVLRALTCLSFCAQRNGERCIEEVVCLHSYKYRPRALVVRSTAAVQRSIASLCDGHLSLIAGVRPREYQIGAFTFRPRQTGPSRRFCVAWADEVKNHSICGYCIVLEE